MRASAMVRPAVVAVIAHGAGSSGDFVRRAFGGPLLDAGCELVSYDDRSGDVDIVARRLGQLADEHAASLVGGVSLGAHAAVQVARVRPRLTGLLLVLPAWTGPPGDVAAMSSAAAAEVDREGLPAVLQRLAAKGWVGEELARAWPAYGPHGLAAALRAAAASAGPDEAELSSLAVPVGIVGIRDDPFHPLQVARAWSRLVPQAALEVVDAAEPAADRATLGQAALRALEAAQGSKR